MKDFDSYQSPFSWRYGSEEMRRIWGEVNRRSLWRWLWVNLAEVQAEFGLVKPEQAADLRQHAGQMNLERSLEIEKEIQHDLMAEIQAFAEQAPLGGGILHLGATSMDIKDNAEVLLMRQSLDLILNKLSALLTVFAGQIERYADLVCMAFTHLQPAEPTTLGYRLANTAQDLLADWQYLKEFRQQLRGKGFKGAVGTSASFAAVLGEERAEERGEERAEERAEERGEERGEERLRIFEKRLSDRLGLDFFEVATQTYPRKQDYQLISLLAGLGASLYKFSLDLRLLQAQPVGEIAEPFGSRQVGSSTMPFKRNPVKAEQTSSLGRQLAEMPLLAWQNAAHSMLERTLDDSANRRTMLPESFLICDEMLDTTTGIVKGLVVNEGAIRRNVARYAPFAALELILMELVKAGADRQEMHERLRQHSMAAWQAIESGQAPELENRISEDPVFQHYLPVERLSSLTRAEAYIGVAPQRAQEFAETLRERLSDSAAAE